MQSWRPYTLLCSCGRSVLALHLKRLFDNAGLPTTKPRDSAPRAVTKEVVGIHVLLARSLFACDILRRFLWRVSLAISISASERF
jgi:hypothetical protein